MSGAWKEPSEVERAQVNIAAQEFVELMNRQDKEGFASGVILAAAGVAIADAISSYHSAQEVPAWFKKQGELAESALSRR